MKKVFIVFVCILQSVVVFSQKKSNQICPPASVQEQRKVMIMEFANEFSQCPVILENVKYYQFGHPTFFETPRIFKEKKIFQIYGADSSLKSTPFSNSINYGEFVVIDDPNISPSTIFDKFKSGDILTLEGKTFIYSSWGNKYNVYFIATKIVNHSIK